MSNQSILAPGIVFTNGLNGTRAQLSYPNTATLTVQGTPNPPPQPPRMETPRMGCPIYPNVSGPNSGSGEGSWF
ncbi:Uu.00g068010.m01.CDS01 [Anthostomella pinea]|uniref:Uu.00g068010.m01.CDS01 n=1 Tax=Anthostomella pinea TaxID=933095 RepID=A0AAI8VU98_9PEZI|nr:Uu.00g068010.m01.CDS01 [Anthostomella pinea]